MIAACDFWILWDMTLIGVYIIFRLGVSGGMGLWSGIGLEGMVLQCWVRV